MRVRLRISICSGCGTLLLRQAPSPVNIPRTRLSQFESRRSIAWKSLFGLADSPSKPKATPPPPDHESRKRAEATVRRLREAKEARKPIDMSPPPDSLPQQESIPPTPPTSANIRKDPPAAAPASPPSRTFTPEKPDGRRVKLKQALSNYNEPLPPRDSGSSLFSKPLREEQKAALKEYLNMASSPQKPKRQEREKYPWEEEPLPPLPWEKGRQNINHVRPLVDSREAELAKEKELRKRIPRIPRVEVPEGPPTGKLYKTLRLHHDIVQKARTMGNEELVSKANQELERQLLSSTQSFGKEDRDLIAFRNLLKPSGKETLPPLITYLLAREGFDPTKGYHLMDKLSDNVTGKDKFGRLTGSLLDEMTWDYYHTKIFRGSAVGIESFACKKTLSQPLTPRPTIAHPFRLVQHQMLLPRSELTFDRDGIIISITDANMIWRSRETIQLWHKDKQLRLSEVNKRLFLGDLERMKNSCIVWTKGARDFQEIYDY